MEAAIEKKRGSSTRKDLGYKEELMRYTEYHSGKAVIKDKSLLNVAMEKLAIHEDYEDRKKKTELSKPDFPVLRNNEKRKEFLKGFHEWPIWFEVPEKKETYYRYNLPDGSSIVICEYSMWAEWKERYLNENPDSSYTEFYLLNPGYRYMHNCKSNESAIVERLKNVQKGLK